MTGRVSSAARPQRLLSLFSLYNKTGVSNPDIQPDDILLSSRDLGNFVNATVKSKQAKSKVETQHVINMVMLIKSHRKTIIYKFSTEGTGSNPNGHRIILNHQKDIKTLIFCTSSSTMSQSHRFASFITLHTNSGRWFRWEGKVSALWIFKAYRNYLREIRNIEF